MKIKEITLLRKKNLGNYENADFGMTVQVDEGDKVDIIVDDLAFYLDYKLNEAERDGKLAKIQNELSVETLADEGRKKREDWIARYKEAAERFNKLEFK